MNRQKRREFRAEEWQEDLDGEDELEGYENLGIESNLMGELKTIITT